MKEIYESLKKLVNQEMISKAARTVEANQSNVTTAAHSIIAGLLGTMLKKGAAPQMREIFEEAGKLDILSDIGNICEERVTHDQQRIGDNYLQHLLGDYAADFTAPIAKSAGITPVAANRLISMIAPVAAGFFGNRMIKDNWSLHQILREIDQQKGSFRNDIPAGLVSAFGLTGLLNAPTAAKVESTTPPVTAKKKKNNGWIAWVVILLLLLLFFLFWRSCRNNRPAEVSERTTVVTEHPANTTNTTPASAITPANRTMTEMTLPDRTKINVYRGGVEEEMIKYLQSNDYKNAKENDLKDKWFTFDNIRFEFNSSTQLESGSAQQLDNIAAILKNFKNAKIKIAGFADKRGSEETNMEISKERAKTIEAMLEQRGVGSQIVRTEGFGDEYATRPASASNDARSVDRDIALRFVK